MFDKVFKNNFEQEQTTYDLKFNKELKRFIVINRDFNDCRDEAIVSGFYKSQLLKIADGLNNWLSEHVIINDEHYFVVTGEYPNLAISKKWYVYKDNYKYCLKDINVNHIDLYENNRVFKTYEEANNKVIELLQQKDFGKTLSVVCEPAAFICGNSEMDNERSKSRKRGK